ncbi:hypothetical protein LINGRAHAP2_LOCUS24214 [Linum grandiflorum]
MSASGVGASTSKQLKRKRNAPGSRRDPGWEYATDVDGNSKKTKCKFCSKVFSGGIFRFKHHIAKTKENVEPCLSVPDDVKLKMLQLLDFNLEAKEVRKNMSSFGAGGRGSNNLLPSSSQSTMSKLLKKDLRKDACRSIARWFYMTGTAFNAAREPEYYTMFELAARHGPGFKPPSYHEIRETLLKEELQVVEEKLSLFKDEWTKLGCSIMSDGWTDRKRRSICNFLDDAVEKVGEENVLQIITDNASAYKAAGTKLMEKNKGRKITNFIYGRSMLISIMKEFTKDQDLIRPAVTRFATAYLTLGCLSKHKGDLMSMFSSEKWKKSAFSSSREGKRIQGIVMDGRFWTNVHTCLCAAMPLVKVLRLVDGDDQPTMPFLYLELNQAREKIKSNFVNNEKRYKPVLDIIEKRWTNQMSRPLHYAAYWLNPKVHFSQGFNESERKLKVGLYDCVERFSKNSEERLTIMEQLDAFHHAKGMFSNYGSMSLLDRKHPADWVHSKKRNRLLQKKMNDIVYVMYNSKLLRRQAKTIERIFDEIDSDDEWVAGDDEGAENVNTEELPSTDNEPTYEVPPENDFTREPLVDNDEQVSYFTFVVVIQNVGFSLQSMILMIILNRDLKEKENSMEMRIKLKIMKMETMTT